MNFKLSLFFALVGVAVWGQLVASEVRFSGDSHPYVTRKLSELELTMKPGDQVSEQAITSDLEDIYLTGVIQEASYELIRDGQGVVLTYRVTGNPIASTITFDGNDSFSKRRLSTHLKTSLELPINLNRIASDRERLESFYHESGYDMFLVKSIEVVPTRNLVYTLDEGMVSDVAYSGLNRIKPFVVEREMRLIKGRPYNRFQLLRDRQRLLNLGYFSEVTNTSLQRSSDGVVLDMRFRERKSNILNLGLEQDEEDVVAFVQGKVNHVLLHSDYIAAKSQIEFEQEARFRSYGVTYHQPWLFNRCHVFMTVNFLDDFRRDPLNQTFLENERIGGDITFGFPLLDDRVVFTTKYKKQRVLPINDGEFDEYMVTSLTWGLSYELLDDVLNPSQGVYASVDYEKSGEIFGVSVEGVEFDRLNTNGALFYSVYPGHVLGFHAFFGRVNQITKTFDGENYSLGGSNSLRGYSEQSFSGSRRVVYNVEYRTDLTKKFQGVVFVDWGKVFEFEQAEETPFEVGQGFGFRYVTPVGPLRLDFAWGEDFFVHFNIGHVF